MAAPAFGFSVGDFFAAIKLLNKAAKALREAAGAKSQFQHAAIEIESIHTLLNQVQSVKPEGCSPDTIRKIHLCALSCHIPLARFISKLRELEPQLDNTKDSRSCESIRGRFQIARRKLQWAFTLDGELTKLKQQLSLQFAAIGIWLQLETMDRTIESRQSVQSTAIGMERCAENIQATLRELKNCIPEASTRRDTTGNVPDGLEQAQKSRDHELMKISRQTLSDTSRLRAEFAVVEDMLIDLRQQVSNVFPRATLSEHSATLDDSRATVAPQYSQTNAQETKCSAEAQAVTRIFSIASMIRQGIERLFLTMLLLIPSVTRIYRTFELMIQSPSFLQQDNIALEDALGRTLSLPYEHFRYWPVFVARLRSSFAGMPGDLKVRQNQFHILSLQPASDLMLTSDSWERTVFPGARLVMSMLYRMDDIKETICPRCKAAGIASSASAWTQCEQCFLQHRVLPQWRTESQTLFCTATKDSIDTTDSREPVLRMDVESDSLLEAAAPDVQFFKRIHFMPLTTSQDRNRRWSNDITMDDHELSCPKCNKTFDTAAELNHHSRCHLKYSQRPFACSTCGARFVSAKDLGRHEGAVHNPIKFYCPHTNCKYANQGFRRKEQLTRHLRNRHLVGLQAPNSSPQMMVRMEEDTPGLPFLQL